MKTILTIFFVIVSEITHSQDLSLDNNPVYIIFEGQCQQKFKLSKQIKTTYFDSLTYFISDSGALKINNSILKQESSFTDELPGPDRRSYRTDSIISILFHKNILTYDNLKQSAFYKRMGKNQYGDTATFTLSLESGDITVFDFVHATDPQRSNKNIITFQLLLIFGLQSEDILAFDLEIETKNNLTSSNLYDKLFDSNLTCIEYVGTVPY